MLSSAVLIVELMFHRRLIPRATGMALVATLAACAAPQRDWEAVAPVGGGILGDFPVYLNPYKAHIPSSSATHESGGRQGNVGFVDLGADGQPRAGLGPTRGTDKANITLNFVNAEMQEFLRTAFDDLLKEPVVIDPQVQGRITIRSGEPVTKAQAIEMVRAALDTHGIHLQKQGGVWQVSSRGNQNNSPSTARVDNTIRMVRLNSISAEQARNAIQPLAGQQVQVSASTEGRYVMLSGPLNDVEGLAQVASALDVDQLRSSSIALLPLREASSSAVSQELTQLFGRDPQAFRAIPVQRINGVLITARSRETIQRARNWVQKLDQAGKDSRRVFVYQLQNRRSGEVAQILQGMFGSGSAQGVRAASDRSSVIAPGLTPALLQSPSTGLGSSQAPIQTAASGGMATGGVRDPESTVPIEFRNDGSGGANGTTNAGVLANSGVSIRADVATNSIVVISRPEEYRIVESAVRRLDVLPSQVLIEATIVEVGLKDALRHGVRWFLQNGNHGASLTDSAAGAGGSVFPGFNYTFNAGSASIVVNALERITDVEIVSSPALTVLDNQTASLKIGDQVPIVTRTARSVVNPDSPQVNEVEMKDTGIILSVTPRVNARGLVMLDISQEASSVIPTTSSGIDSPTIRQRKINSSVVVQSGGEVILGGIISRQRDKVKEGVPGLMHIPILGAAFTSQARNDNGRTELLIIIRPTVVTSRQDLQILTQEIRSRVGGANVALYRR